MKKVTIYTDGACSGNPGPGGWGTILIYGDYKKELSGYMPDTTNNRMELFAIIQGLDALKQSCIVDVYSDSAYVINAFNEGWIFNWQKNGWKKSDKKNTVENMDLWKYLLRIMERHQVSFHKVKGHANDPINNRCDKLATDQIKANNR